MCLIIVILRVCSIENGWRSDPFWHILDERKPNLDESLGDWVKIIAPSYYQHIKESIETWIGSVLLHDKILWASSFSTAVILQKLLAWSENRITAWHVQGPKLTSYALHLIGNQAQKENWEFELSSLRSPLCQKKVVLTTTVVMLKTNKGIL